MTRVGTHAVSRIRTLTPADDLGAVFAALAGVDPKWRADVGVPEPVDGWIRGDDFRDATRGPFQALLARMAARTKTADRMTLAASFALRFGWAGAIAIAPYLTHRCVPHVPLDNISIKFRETTLFERTALHVAHGWRESSDVTSGGARDDADHDTDHDTNHDTGNDASGGPLLQGPLLQRLRDELQGQAEPVVRALYDWSGFSVKGSWGMITSSWAAQFITVCERLGGQALAAPIMEAFFAGTDDVARMQPRTHPVSMQGVTHLYQRRASCCRYYLLPQGDLCASCPLVSHEERLSRNTEFMAKQLARASVASV